jgi:hypothetical protein
MFVRFRQTKRRLQVSLAETRRIDGRVQQEYVASFGSVPVPPSVQDRLAFWRRLHERLSRLSNRVPADIQGEILGDIHARIPMATLDEIQAAKIEAAEADERFWSGLYGMHTEQMEGHKRLIAGAEGQIAARKAEAEKCAAAATETKDRIERLKRGEDIGRGLSKPDWEKMLRESGWTTRDINYARLLAEVSSAFGRGEVLKLVWESRENVARREEMRIVRRLKSYLDQRKLEQ